MVTHLKNNNKCKWF